MLTAARWTEEAQLRQEELDADGRDSIDHDGGYGWVCVLSVFLINCHTWGLNSAYGVLLSYYLDNDGLYPGASPTIFAYIGGLSMSQAFMISPLVAQARASRYSKHFMFLGVFLLAGSFIGASFSTQTWHLFLSQGICFGWGMGILFVGTAGALPQWFSRRTGLANSLGSAGSGVGGLTYTLVVNRLITEVGYQDALRILGSLAFIFNFVAVVLLKDRKGPPSRAKKTFDKKLIRDPNLLLLLLYGFFNILGYVVCLYSLPTYASSIGLSSSQGAITSAVFCAGQVIGRPVIGLLCDRLNITVVTMLASGLQGILVMVFWPFAKSYGLLIFLSALMGTVAGTFWAVISPLIVDVLGFQTLDVALSITFLVITVPSTFAEVIAISIADASGGNFFGAMMFTGSMYLASAAFLAIQSMRGCFGILRSCHHAP